MIFKTIADEANYYRDLTDYKLMGNSYVMVMLDGRSFSKMIKNKFKKPFDKDFINMMNETAKYICENTYGCVLGYVQSDEISLIIKDTNENDGFFGYRMCKILSILSSMATGKFNQLMTLYQLKNHPSINPYETINKMPLCEFDCKCWNVPNRDKAFQWIIYRQNDCVRNSKQQAAQTYLSHNTLLNKNTDEQVELLQKQKGINWYQDYSNGEKYGRVIYKEAVYIATENGNTYRNKWFIHDAISLNNEEYRVFIKGII